MSKTAKGQNPMSAAGRHLAIPAGHATPRHGAWYVGREESGDE